MLGPGRLSYRLGDGVIRNVGDGNPSSCNALDGWRWKKTNEESHTDLSPFFSLFLELGTDALCTLEVTSREMDAPHPDLLGH